MRQRKLDHFELTAILTPTAPFVQDLRLGLTQVRRDKQSEYAPLLAAVAKGHQHPFARVLALDALAQTAGKKHMETFRGALSDKDPLARAAALQALGELGSSKDLPLMENLAFDHDKAVRDLYVISVARLKARTRACVAASGSGLGG